MYAFLILLKVSPVATVVPSLLSSGNRSTRLEVITQYFHADFKYAEIILPQHTFWSSSVKEGTSLY
jgi:hypothetical protein